jgi:hypothetical protein
MKPATKIAMVLLSLVAIAHLLRVLFGLEIIVGSWNVPMWGSYLGTVIPGALAYFIYREHQ